ncbi:hypothetical protein [Microbulbifer sp. ALW1]|uniref:hypothetical protein n=1 Tax=Microbulbifer sp. (strain ALW1) TaxID=1516059 RepID=UPI00135786C5|nr:hypothetical protein [Microbulbifer sp. ALW1]
MKVQLNLQVSLAVALVLSVAGNVFGFIQYQKVSDKAAETQLVVASLQKKLNAFERRDLAVDSQTRKSSREEYLERRAKQQRQQNSLSRLSTQQQTAEARMAQASREVIQRRQLGSPQAIQ